MKKIFILGGLRTPIGGFCRSLKDISPISLSAMVVKSLLKRHGIKGSLVDEVIMGNAVSAGLGQNPARQSLMYAGLPAETTAFTVNQVCGSSLKSVILATQSLLCGDAVLVIAGGLESASQTPYICSRNKKLEEIKLETLSDSLIKDGLWCNLNETHMGMIAEYTAKQFKISREEQDRYALKSHQKALYAQENSLFNEEIVHVELNGRCILGRDEKPRKNISLEKLLNLPPAFVPGGTVTAGNSSAPADGAAALILSTEQALKKHRLTPLARILGYAWVAVEPKLVFTAPALAIKKCLRVSSLKMSEVDFFEINETFSVQVLLTMRLCGIEESRANIFGGAIALGHPLGVSGARCLVTLINVLKKYKKR